MKFINRQTINHVWDGSQQIVADIVDSQFYEANCYIRGTNLVAKYSFFNGTKSEYTYYTQNAHGDVVNLTDAEGNVTKTYTYDAFGVEKNIDASDTNAFRYCGEYYDAETGTIYLRARYYNPSIGRFISRDSFAGKKSDPLSLNLYTYCANNPIVYIDPSGNSFEAIGDFFSTAGHFISNTLETAKGYCGSIGSSITSCSSVYAGCGATALADSPVPGPADVIAAIAAGVVTGYCVYEGVKTYNEATVLPREGTYTNNKNILLSKTEETSSSKSITIAKTKIKSVLQKKNIQFMDQLILIKM